jgi:uncharacterized protein YfaS (alpha-2-macroglobulin family)
VTDKTNVIFDGLKPQNAQIHIMNTNGQLVKRVDVKTDESYSYQLDCADLLPGIYFVQIVTEGGATYSNVRLMKQ